MKYYIEVEEKRSTLVEIEAESKYEAIAKAELSYNDGVICLDDPECTDDGGTSFSDETERYNNSVEAGIVIPQRVDFD